jgi:hypothetical protein
VGYVAEAGRDVLKNLASCESVNHLIEDVMRIARETP